MIATVVRSGLSGEPVDDRQLTAVAIMAGKNAVNSHLSRSCGPARLRAHNQRARITKISDLGVVRVVPASVSARAIATPTAAVYETAKISDLGRYGTQRAATRK